MEKILFEYYDFNEEYAIESAWAEKSGSNYKLDNILFYARNYSFGDIVEVDDRNGELYVVGLIEELGHSTVRIFFYEREILQSTLEELEKMGCEYEGSNIPNLVAIDIPPETDYSEVREILGKGEIAELWSYEESCLAHK